MLPLGGGDQFLQRRIGMQLCFRVGEQTARKVETQADAVEFECELPRVESVAKVSFNNGLLAHSPDTIDPDLLMIDEKIA